MNTNVTKTVKNIRKKQCNILSIVGLMFFAVRKPCFYLLRLPWSVIRMIKKFILKKRSYWCLHVYVYIIKLESMKLEKLI